MFCRNIFNFAENQIIMRLKILLFCFLITNLSFSQKEENKALGDTIIIEEYHANGKIMIEAKMINDSTFVGPFKQYYQNGKIKIERMFGDEGTPKGTWKEYYPNGKVKMIFNLNPLGENIAYIRYYHDNGNLRAVYNADKNRVLNGMFEEYDEEGNLKLRGYYKNGEKTGVWEAYFDGMVYETKEF